MGGGIAVDLASRQPVADLIMESFITAFRVVASFAIVPFDNRNIDKVKSVHCPVLGRVLKL